MKRLIICTGSLAVLIACSKTPQVVATTAAGFASSQPAGDIRPVATTTGAPAARGVEATPNASTVEASIAYRDVTLPAGTVLPVDLETTVGSDISRVEQPVQGRIRRAVIAHGVQVLPVGTAISGHVTAARRPGRVKGRSYIAMRFTQLDTPGAGTSRISTAAVSRTGRATKEKDTLKIVAPATAGAVIGRIAGGKSGAAKGALIGGGAGTAYVLSTRGEEVRLARGTNLAVRLTAPLTVRVPAW